MLDGDPIGTGATLPGWGYGMRLEFHRTVTLNPERIRQGAGLGRQSILRLSCSWSAQAAVNFGGIALPIDVDLSRDESSENYLTIEVPSTSIAERLQLQTVVVLQSRGSDTTSPIAASVASSILWKESVTLNLEGQSARMPILALDFTNLPGAERDAAWFVWTGPDWLLQDPTAGITVYVNDSRLALLAALSARQPDSHQMSIRSIFFHDVGRSLIERALNDDDFTDDVDYREGCGGWSLRATLASLFGGQSLGQIRKFRETDPAGFERTLQARHNLLKALT
jgi:hypothetical protein